MSGSCGVGRRAESNLRHSMFLLTVPHRSLQYWPTSASRPLKINVATQAPALQVAIQPVRGSILARHRFNNPI